MSIRPFVVRLLLLGSPLAFSFGAGSLAQSAAAGRTSSPDSAAAPSYSAQPVAAILDWTPPALDDLTAQASSKTSFSFDRSMLEAIAALEGGNDPAVRRAWAKLDGVNVRVLRFGPDGVPAGSAMDALRAAYHARGLKYLVTSTNAGGPVHSGSTDVWIVVDGANARGAVILKETARSLTLITVKGDVSPEDLFHLRGHFGIPAVDQTDAGVRN